MKKINLHTDGSALGNPGRGGWGYILIFNKQEFEGSGSVKYATNNQMELQAAISGLQALTEPCEVNLYSDSKYVLTGMSDWMNNWKKNNWKSSSKKDIKNKDLWKTLDKLKEKHKITNIWVKGHNGDKYNERADALANTAAHNA